MQVVGKLIDYIDRNHEKKHVKYSLTILFSVFMITTAVQLYNLPTHEEYCQSAVDNPTCMKYK